MTSAPRPLEPANAPEETLQQIPRDRDELSVHLSLDQPPGEHVALLLDYYASRSATVAEARYCVDECIEYLDEIKACRKCGAPVQFSHVKTCVNHRHAEPSQ